MNPWVGVAVSAFKEGAILTAIDVPVSFVIGLVLDAPFTSVLGFLLLLESVALMLIGGATELGGTPSAKRIFSLLSRKEFDWSASEFKKVESRGAFYSIIGVMFFVEALALAFATIGL